MKLSIIVPAILICNVASAQRQLVQNDHDSCHYLESRDELRSHDQGGPFKLEHFHLTKGRTELREFLWRHWHDRLRGVAEAKVETVEVGTVTVLYVVQPDAHGHWGIDVEISRPLQPKRCSTFHADALVRVLIRKAYEDYPSQTLGPYWEDGTVPGQFRMAESEVKDSKFHTVILMANGKAIGDTI